MPSSNPSAADSAPVETEQLRATYRLQFRPGFGLNRAHELLDYLAALGISHLYASPLLAARPGSNHGYDVVDPTRLNPELGSEADFERLHHGLRQRGMGLLLDIVPNHMAVHPENHWWWNVLELGPGSTYAQWFDIDWQAGSDPAAAGRVVLPVLGRRLPAALARGEIELVAATGRPPVLRYFQHEFPLNPPPSAEPLDPTALRRLILRQHYLLAFWRAAGEQINYRRFFAINELIGFRVEHPAAFAASHRLIAAWLRGDAVQALRVDHVDGLHDPAAYLHRLRDLCPAGAHIWVEKILASGEALPPDWPVDGTTGYDFLSLCDRLQIPAAGYNALLRGYRMHVRRNLDFAAVSYGKKRQLIRALFNGEMRRFSRQAAALAGGAASAPPEARTEALMIRALITVAACYSVYRTYACRLGEHGPEMAPAERARVQAAAACAQQRNPRLPAGLLQWTGDLLSASPEAAIPPAQHSQWLRFLQRWQQFTAPIMAKGQEDTALYVFVPLASLDEVGGDPEHPTLAPADFHEAMRERQRLLPQTLNASSTHDTKRSEDVRARLNALAEMPDEWLRWVRQWTRWNRGLRRLVRRRPAPDRNAEYLLYQTLLGVWPLELGETAPEAAPSPEFVSRIQAYMQKAEREATLQTEWAHPNLEYEAALAEFIAAILDPVRSPRFLAGIRAAASRLAPAGALNSLVQLTLKVLSPGVPDFYQGCECWNFSLVDPDNRRPVDFTAARRALRAWSDNAPDPARLLDHWRTGEVKLWLTQRLLHIRGRSPALFLEGAYLPVPLAGAHRERALAFVRHLGNEAVLVVVPIGVATASLGRAPKLEDFHWGDTRVAIPSSLSFASHPWVDLLARDPRASAPVESAAEIELGRLLRGFPVAVLGRRF